MTISVSRGGIEIGEWPKEEVVRRYKSGDLSAADFYWHEGMEDWEPLRSLIKPPQPNAPTAIPVAQGVQAEESLSESDEEVSNTDEYFDMPVKVKVSLADRIAYGLPQLKIGRIAFLGWMAAWLVLFVAWNLLFNYAEADDSNFAFKLYMEVFLVALPSCVSYLFILALRLRSMGYPGWYALIGLMPLFNVLLILACLFMRPREKLKISRWKTAFMAFLAVWSVASVYFSWLVYNHEH